MIKKNRGLELFRSGKLSLRSDTPWTKRIHTARAIEESVGACWAYAALTEGQGWRDRQQLGVSRGLEAMASVWVLNTVRAQQM